MAEELLGPGVRDPRRRARPRLPPPRERGRPVAGARARRSPSIWAHNGLLQFGRRQDVEVGAGTSRRSARCSTAWGRETALVFFLGGHWRKPIDFSDETIAQAAAQAEGFREVFRRPSEAAPAGAWERFAVALDDDFNTPGRARGAARVARPRPARARARRLRARVARRAPSRRRPRSSSSRSARVAARAARDFELADRLRAEIEAAGWEMRDEPGGYTLVRAR